VIFHIHFNRKSPCYIPRCGGAVFYSASGISKACHELRWYLMATATLFSVESRNEKNNYFIEGKGS